MNKLFLTTLSIAILSGGFSFAAAEGFGTDTLLRMDSPTARTDARATHRATYQPNAEALKLVTNLTTEPLEDGIAVNWDAPEAADQGFVVERSYMGQAWEVVAIFPASTSTLFRYEDRGLGGGTPYSYRIGYVMPNGEIEFFHSVDGVAGDGQVAFELLV